MSRSWIGWAAGIVLGLAGGTVLGMLSSDREARKRLGDSTRRLRERVAGSAHDVREKGEEWRDKRVEDFGRAVFQAAEARDATLNAVDEPDEDTDSIHTQDSAAASAPNRAL